MSSGTTTRMRIRPCSSPLGRRPPRGRPCIRRCSRSCRCSRGSVRAAQLSGVVTGCATVALTGFVGRRVAGAGVGLVAAALAAVSPLLLAADGAVMSETFFVPLALVTLLAALAAGRSGRVLLWIAAGVAAGLAALTRTEGLLLIPFVVLPVAWRASRASVPTRVARNRHRRRGARGRRRAVGRRATQHVSTSRTSPTSRRRRRSRGRIAARHTGAMRWARGTSPASTTRVAPR